MKNKIIIDNPFDEDQIYDFYYSEKHVLHLQEISISFIFGDNKPCVCEIDGKIYTEVISVGKTPLTNHFGDLVKVFTGNMKTFKFLGRY